MRCAAAALPVAFALSLALGCAPHVERLSARERGWLVAPESIPGAFLWRLRVTLVRGERRESFDVALQKRCGEIRFVWLAPLAPAPIVVVQRGRELSSSGAAAARGAGFAERVLLDLERALLLPLRAPASGAGELRSRAGEQEIVERWEGGRLLERSVRAPGARGPLVVTYSGWDAGAPERTVLRREDLHAEVDAISRAPLEQTCADP